MGVHKCMCICEGGVCVYVRVCAKCVSVVCECINVWFMRICELCECELVL